MYNTTVHEGGIITYDLDELVLWSKKWLLPFNKHNLIFETIVKTTPTLNII